MEDLRQVMEDMESFTTGTAHEVRITHVREPYVFYVRLAKYDNLIDAIEFSMPFKRPDRVYRERIVMFDLNKGDDEPRIARGIIQRVNRTSLMYTCDIYAQDYGYFERNVNQERIWSCLGVYLYYPPLAKKCEFADCIPNPNANEYDAMKALKLLVEYIISKIIIREQTSDLLKVLLYNCVSENVGTLLAQVDFTKTDAISRGVPLDVKRAEPYSFQFKKPEVNKSLHVKTIYGRDFKYFFVAELIDYMSYRKLWEHLAWNLRFDPAIRKENMKIGEIVAVKYDPKMYIRGIVKKFNSRIAIVFLIDVGREDVCYLRNIRKMPERYLGFPILSIYCQSESCETDNYTRNVYLSPGYEFLMTIKQTGYKLETPYIVTMSQLPDQ